jgi:hypothetical protein
MPFSGVVRQVSRPDQDKQVRYELLQGIPHALLVYLHNPSTLYLRLPLYYLPLYYVPLYYLPLHTL